MDNTVIISDYRQMDKVMKEERTYLLNMCKKIKKAGCNVLLIQKSILRDAVNETSLHFLAKLGVVVVKDVERDEIDFLCKSTGARPIADIDAFTEDKLGSAELVEETEKEGARIVKITGVKNPGRTVSVVCMVSTRPPFNGDFDRTCAGIGQQVLKGQRRVVGPVGPEMVVAGGYTYA